MIKFFFIPFVFVVMLYSWGIAQSINSPDSISTSIDSGILFEKEVKYLLQDSSYSDVIQLRNLPEKAQAMQFRLLFNKATDDSTILIFKEIQKGSDLNDPGWLLDFNVVKGPILPNGAAKDEVFVVLYNMNQNGGLLPGDYKNLFIIKYEVPKLSGLKKDIKSSIIISHAEASTFQGFAIDIKPDRDEVIVYVK